MYSYEDRLRAVQLYIKLRRAIVITSNRVVQDWGKYLGDATMASTILDRLMHRCAMLEFEGKS
jgi:DNA replication protein DnaC